MRLTRKSQAQQFLDTAKTLNDSIDALKGGSTRRRILTAAVITGGLAGLTAGSAAVSSLRRRMESTG